LCKKYFFTSTQMYQLAIVLRGRPTIGEPIRITEILADFPDLQAGHIQSVVNSPLPEIGNNDSFTIG